MLVQLSPVLSQDVKIGTQVWMSKNLDVSTFRNGEVIPEVKSQEEWNYQIQNRKAAWCYYDNDEKNGKKYGKLYNWYAVNDSRGLAPKGYHIPSGAEWTVLTDFLGGKYLAGYKMKSKSGWVFKGNENPVPRLFNGFPGGYRDGSGAFSSVGKRGNWWSSVEGDPGHAWFCWLYYDSGSVIFDESQMKLGFSVRCIKD
jgi:uncharacterized protein (TIGR02145 family)